MTCCFNCTFIILPPHPWGHILHKQSHNKASYKHRILAKSISENNKFSSPDAWWSVWMNISTVSNDCCLVLAAVVVASYVPWWPDRQFSQVHCTNGPYNELWRELLLIPTYHWSKGFYRKHISTQRNIWIWSAFSETKAQFDNEMIFANKDSRYLDIQRDRWVFDSHCILHIICKSVISTFYKIFTVTIIIINNNS